MRELASVAPPRVARAAQPYLSLLTALLAVSPSDPNYSMDGMAVTIKASQAGGAALDQDNKIMSNWASSACHVRETATQTTPTR
jgi:hypothetical protein